MSESTSFTGGGAGGGAGAGAGSAAAAGLLRTRFGFSASKSSAAPDGFLTGAAGAGVAESVEDLVPEAREVAAFFAGAAEGASAPEAPVDFGLDGMQSW
jgi:hypothetical protein